MVNIIASIMEEKFKVKYDDLVNQIHLLSKELDKAQIKAENLEIELEEYRSIAESIGAEKAISEKEKLEIQLKDFALVVAKVCLSIEHHKQFKLLTEISDYKEMKRMLSEIFPSKA